MTALAQRLSPGGGARDGTPQLGVRWATWWPAPYWIDRFNHLAARGDVDFEAIFLSAADTYHGWDLDPSAWRFRYRILSPRAADSGYDPGVYSRARSIKNPFPLLREARERAIVMTYGDPTFVAAAALARAARTPYYLFVANTEYEQRSGNRAIEALKRLIFTSSAGFLVTGPLQERYARRYARPDAPVAVIGNPVDTERLLRDARELLPHRAALRARRRWEGSCVLGFVGRLAEEKDLGTLLCAARELRTSGIAVELALAGSGPLEADLRRLAAELAVPTRFEGFLEGRELSEFYASIDAFVLPSVSEPWGLVVNEAMEFSLPVVLSDRVGAQHLVSAGIAGCVFRAGDAADLARSLRPLVEHEEARRTMGAAAREIITGETIATWSQAVVDGLRSFRGELRPAAVREKPRRMEGTHA